MENEKMDKRTIQKLISNIIQKKNTGVRGIEKSVKLLFREDEVAIKIVPFSSENSPTIYSRKLESKDEVNFLEVVDIASKFMYLVFEVQREKGNKKELTETVVKEEIVSFVKDYGGAQNGK